jgi:3-hydroxybutyryl-CoA dehydratase
LGYDRIRFLKAVLIGDTISIRYRIIAADAVKLRTTAEIELKNQSENLCAVAQHVMRWILRD